MVKSGYKHTEVGIFPEQWNVISLEDAAPNGGLVRGPFGGTLKKEYFVKSGYKVYEQKNAIYKTTEIGNYFIDSKKFNELNRFSVIPGDFIVSCSGTIGRIYQIPKDPPEGVINQALLKIRLDKDKIDDKFFEFIFESDQFQEKIIENTHGGAMQNLVGMDVFRKTKFQLPALLEQRAIAKALTDIDALIARLDKLITKKKDIKTATIQQLLTGKKRLPGFSGAWKKKRLGILANITMGQSPSSVFYNNQSEGLPLIQGNADIKERKTIIRNYTSHITKRCYKDDIILSVRAPVGEVAKAKFDACIGRGVCAISYPNEYLYHYLISIESSWERLSKGSTFDSVNSDEIKSIEIHLPEEFKEQDAIASVLNDIDADILALVNQRKKIEAIKQGMMQELLNGRTRLI